jgi:NAD+ synthase (glutamine-hydrolysing)
MPVRFGFVRVAAASPPLRVANPAFNADQTLRLMHEAYAQGAQLALFPELGLTGYTCGELFLQDRLLDDARAALQAVCRGTNDLPGMIALVGLPLVVSDHLFNAQAVLQDGQVLGLVPKTYRPEYGEFMESHWMSSAREYAGPPDVPLFDAACPFSPDLVFHVPNVPNFDFGVALCEDDWPPISRSSWLALAGAKILCNASASNELVGKGEYRRDVIVVRQSQTCLAAYVYASAGPWESTTSLVFGGHCMIAENGAVLGESPRFDTDPVLVVRDVDVQRMSHERRRQSSFREAAAELAGRTFRHVTTAPSQRDPARPSPDRSLLREVDATPFVPADSSHRSQVCEEIFNIQTTALWRRLEHIGSFRTVLGLSGGLDSTHAALVIRRTLDRAGADPADMHLVTMPGFGTSSRTLENAKKLGRALSGRAVEVIDIRPACLRHFQDIGHPAASLAERDLASLPDKERAWICDLVFENVQARERKQVLMDRAGMLGAIDVGTSDLTELALGWCTYNGDHMSNYHVNVSVPKTLIRYLVDYVADTWFSGETAAVLHDILDTPISPELLPLSEGDITQKTEEELGPFLVHDFFIYSFMRAGYPPRKMLFLAAKAFEGTYTEDQLRHWLEIFLRRFFANQFKSNCLPDGPKVGTVSFDPRSDWRVPSDADCRAWLRDLEASSAP